MECGIAGYAHTIVLVEAVIAWADGRFSHWGPHAITVIVASIAAHSIGAGCTAGKTIGTSTQIVVKVLLWFARGRCS